MEIRELERLIFSIKDKELIQFLDLHLDVKKHSKTLSNLELIRTMDKGSKMFLIARLESICEGSTIGSEIAGYSSILVSLFVLLDKIGGFELIVIMGFIGVIGMTVYIFGESIYKRSKARFFLSLINNSN